MLPKDHHSDDLLRRWISGALTAPEEAELERRATSEHALGEALAGLRTAPETDHQARVASMLQRVQPGLKAAPRRRPRYVTYAIAASVAMLLGLSIWLLPEYFAADSETEIALERRAPVPGVPASPLAIDPAPAPPRPEADVAEEDAVAEAAPPTGQDSVATAPTAAPVAVEMADERAEESVFEPATPEVAAAPRIAPPVREVAPLEAPPLRASPTNRIPAAPAPVPPLTGEVTDEDGKPIAGAEVMRVGQALGQETDSNGVFQLPLDRTLSELVVRAAGYEAETVEVFGNEEQLQISLTPLAFRARADISAQNAARTEINMEPVIRQQSRALPVEGYRQLRERIEADRPEGVPKGKVRVSFLVQADGTLTDFRFQGQPDRATMDYVGTALTETSTWNVVPAAAAPDTSRPVRVYFKLRFD